MTIRQACSTLAICMLCSCAFAQLPQPGLHSQKQGDCSACKTNEFSVTANSTVDHGEYAYDNYPPCETEMSADMKQLSHSLADALLPGSSEIAGPLIDANVEGTLHTLKSTFGGEVGKFLNKYAPSHSACVPVCAVVPKDATITAATYMAAEADGGGAAKCTKDTNGWIICPIGWSGWEDIERNGKLACGRFKNWSHNLSRQASLTVYFTVPEGSEPIPLR